MFKITQIVKVSNDENISIKNVNIIFNGVLKQITDDSGLFDILLIAYRYYTINCKKVLDSRNGVTTADLVAINKYILKIDTFTTKYRNIAADINSDKKVSISDMIELRKLILFINDTFTNSDSWKFIPKDYKLSKIPEADDYPTSISFYLDSPKTFDFIGIKVGDVNGSVKANGLLEAEERSIVAKKINIQNFDLHSNTPIELKLPIAELFDHDGFQLSLRLDPDLVELVSLSGIDADSYHFDEQTGVLLIAFVKGFSKGNELVLNLLPKTNCSLLQALSFPESKMKQEYYNQNQSFSYSFEWVNPQFELFPSQPNPFSTSTVLRYFSPKVTSIDFDIYNSNGQLVKHQIMICKDGINELEVAGNELIGTGVYHCQFKTDLGIFFIQ
ncbi:MAG: hypothetical protein IPL95_19820 [Saprospiraceae bacterium]|nr:hypothetical protein [Saprospiraceae bacterium]